MKKKCYVLGIETSCDETSVAVVKNGRELLSNVISSQIDIHKKFGGVVPEIASRKHVELIIPVIDEALKNANITIDEIDVIAVTYGPGLVGALLIGVSAAKAIAISLNKPIVGVNHIKGHIFANYLENKELEPPYISLVASGGHSHIVHVKNYTEFKILGQTRDDAAGEAFDKIARALGLGYPGGPIIDKIAKEGNSSAVNFPRVSFGKESLDFSFSGLKTAVLNYMNNQTQKGERYSIEDVAASFQKAVVDVLVANLIKATKQNDVRVVTLAGGVAANSLLRQQLIEISNKEGLKTYYPSPILCTDNAAMIACAGYYEYMNGSVSDYNLNAEPSLKLGV